MKRSWLKLYKGAEKLEGRETYAPVIAPELDVLLTMVCQMKDLKKEAVIHEITERWVNDQIDPMTDKELSRYAKMKKADPQSKQAARHFVVEKVDESEENETEQEEEETEKVE